MDFQFEKEKLYRAKMLIWKELIIHQNKDPVQLKSEYYWVLFGIQCDYIEILRHTSYS